MTNDELNAMNAKMLLDMMTEKPPSRERLFKDYDNGDEFEAARYGLELPKKYPGQTITIIDDNHDGPRVEWSQIQHLLTGEVYRASTAWNPESVTRLLRMGNFL